MHAASVPVPAGEVFQIFAQEKHAHEILRGVADEKFGEGRNLRLLHRLGVAAVLDPQIDQGVGCGIMRARRPLGGLARHSRGQQAARRLAVEERTGEALLGPFRFAADGGAHRGTHVALLRHGVDQAQRPRAAGAFAAPGQHHGHRVGRIDQARQPHRAAEAGMQAELHLGKAEARVIDGNAIVAGERHFESAAETIAVNDGDRDRRQAVEPVEHGMAARERRFDLRHIGDAAKLRDIGAGDEAAGFRRADNDSPRRIAFEFFEDRIKLGQYVFRQRIGA